MTDSGPLRLITRVTRHLVLIAVAIVMIYPLLWMIASALRPSDEIFHVPGLLPPGGEVGNYVKGWTALRRPFSTYLLNSTLLVIGCVIGNLVSCALTAYAFARMRFWGRQVCFAVMLGTIMLPVHVVIVPQYILFCQTGWVNTMVPLVLPKFLATDAFFVFLMVQFIRGIPRELDEAARIDGCGHVRIFSRIILPLMTPALATTAVFTTIWLWNDFFASLIYLTSPDKFTVPLALRAFLDAEGSSEWGPMFAMSVLSLLPMFLVFLVGFFGQHKRRYTGAQRHNRDGTVQVFQNGGHTFFQIEPVDDDCLSAVQRPQVVRRWRVAVRVYTNRQQRRQLDVVAAHLAHHIGHDVGGRHNTQLFPGAQRHGAEHRERIQCAGSALMSMFIGCVPRRGRCWRRAARQRNQQQNRWCSAPSCCQYLSHIRAPFPESSLFQPSN